MSQEFSVLELFENKENLIGKSVAVNAVLVLRGKECYLTQSFNLNADERRIEVCSSEIEEKLNLSVPCWVGGPATYFDTVKMVGILQEGIGRKDTLFISEISFLLLYRDEDIYEIEF